MALRPTPISTTSSPTAAAARPTATSTTSTATTTTTTMKPSPTPPTLSWKDAVKNGVPATTTPLKTMPSKRSKHAGDHRVTHYAAAANDHKQRPSTCPRAKLLRSRSVSRIVGSPTFRKRNDAHPSPPKNSSSATSVHAASLPAAATASLSASASPLHNRGVNTHRALAATSPQRMQPSTATTAASQRERTTLPSAAQSATAASQVTADAAPPSRRPRAASADLVLLRTSAQPHWLLTASRRTGSTSRLLPVHNSESTSNRCRRAASTSDVKTTADARLSGVVSNSDVRRIEHADRRSAAAAAARASMSPAGATTCCRLNSNSSADDDSEHSELDDDTNSESTAVSSCPSPRHSPIAAVSNGCDHVDARSASSLLLNDNDVDDDDDVEDPQDIEAMLLLDRINELSAEFAAHRAYEDANALSWSVAHAARQGVLSSEVAANLLANIHAGDALDEARDVLYHKCHLVPAVGRVVESPAASAALSPALEQAFVDDVDAMAPTDEPAARVHKLRVLKRLSDILTLWVQQVGRERCLPEEHVAITSGSLFLAGSYRLGLNDPTSDIDAVCIVPYHVTHEDFFSSFVHLLASTDGVTHLAPVPNAFVPLISLSCMGVSMDLLFARLPIASVESHHEIDADYVLYGVHAASMKSLNAPRTSSMLLCLVPKRRVFRIVLRAVRSWARRRGIYSAKLGYLGGISWAILVAFVCQMYPDAEPAKVFVRFFQVMSEWHWPQPILLNVVYDAGLGFDMWDPRRNVYDRSHIMPVITPAYPHMNSAVQVSQSTFSVLLEEFWRARYVAEAAVLAPPAALSMPLGGEHTAWRNDAASSSIASSTGRTSDVEIELNATAPREDEMVAAATDTSSVSTDTTTLSMRSHRPSPWTEVFACTNFFVRYETFLVVDYAAATLSEMHQWGKFVTSRVRKLVDSVQLVPFVARVQALPTCFATTSTGATPGACLFLGVELYAPRRQARVPPHDDPNVQQTLDQTIRFFLATDLQQFEFKQASMTATAHLLRWGDLPAFVFPRSDRTQARLERRAYVATLEAFAQSSTPPTPATTTTTTTTTTANLPPPPTFRPSFYSNSYARTGRFHNGQPRKYNGGGKGKHQRQRENNLRPSS